MRKGRAGRFCFLLLLNLCLSLCLTLTACKKSEEALWGEFPAAQERLEAFVSREDGYWDRLEISYEDKNRQGITFRHGEEALCAVNLNSLDGTEISGIGLTFWYREGWGTPGDSNAYEEAQRDCMDVLACFILSVGTRPRSWRNGSGSALTGRIRRSVKETGFSGTETPTEIH